MQRSNQLLFWRRRLGFSRQELGAKSGVSPATINMVELYQHYPRPETRQRIAAALGVEEATIWPEVEPKGTNSNHGGQQWARNF